MERKKTPKVDLEKLRGLFFSISLSTSLLLVIVAFEWKSDTSHVVITNLDIATQNELLEIPPTVQEPPKAPAIIQPKVIEVPDEEEIKEDIKVIIDLSESEIENDYTPVVAPKVEEVSDEVFLIVEARPQFPGGDTELFKFLTSHVKYPTAARRMAIEGRVYLTMIVEKDGSITNPEVARGFDAGCDQEAIRVAKLMPKWIPGKQRGQPVRVKVTLPISFKLGR